ncbi:MAG: hypothetical protein VZR04_03260, partial [Succiniclasticum sp.]|nr:hypothetical protein [Succiniclasticum sp.]
HPNQGLLRVYDIDRFCLIRFQLCTRLYKKMHYLQLPPTSSPVSRTTETLGLQGFPIFLCAEKLILHSGRCPETEKSSVEFTPKSKKSELAFNKLTAFIVEVKGS